MKTAIVLVGHHEVTEDRYQPIVQVFKDNGWEAVSLYEPDWSITSVAQLVDGFLAQLPHDHDPLTLLGFSLGAMISLIAASKIPVENLIVCSPSGYFVEYDPLLSKDDRAWANKHLTDFRDFSAANIIDNIQATQGFILAGQAEIEQWPEFRKWAYDLKAQTNWQYGEVPKTGHEIGAPAYQDAIKQVVHTVAQQS